jgi:hypothetical protein
MTQIYLEALRLTMNRLKVCGLARATVSDEYTASYWELELAKANHLRLRIQKRLKLNHNVIKVDFQLKRKVA